MGPVLHPVFIPCSAASVLRRTTTIAPRSFTPLSTSVRSSQTFIRPYRCRHFVSTTSSTSTATTPSMAADRKMLHVVYRVGDSAGSKSFFTSLGMKTLRERDIAEEKYSNAFFGYGPEQRGEYFAIETTYNYGVTSYEIGSAFGYLSIACADLRKQCDTLGIDSSTIATDEFGEEYVYTKDPTGYTFKLLQRTQRDPLCQVMLRVKDVAKAAAEYKAMGMKVLNEKVAGCSILGFDDDEFDSTVLKLAQCSEGESMTMGDGYGQIAVSCPDVYETTKNIEAAGVQVARAPGPVPGIGTKIMAAKDADGWKVVFVDADDFEKEFE